MLSAEKGTIMREKSNKGPILAEAQLTKQLDTNAEHFICVNMEQVKNLNYRTCNCSVLIQIVSS